MITVGRVAGRARSPTPSFPFTIQKKLHVYDGGEFNRQSQSGINATIFGGSGFMGSYIGAKLGYIGSNLIFPINYQFHYHSAEPLKQLKLLSATGKSWVHKQMNYRDQNMIERMINNSNVVINLVGPRKNVKKRQDYEFVNIEVAERVAHACKKKGVARLIHFSAAGAYEHSASQDFQTKAIGEKNVLKIFPDATIFRPCPVYGYNDYFSTIIERQFLFFFRKFCIVSDNCKAKKQPINVLDVATCVLNALKLDNTRGKIFELGGPNVLSYLQVYEILFNYLRYKPNLAYIDPDVLKLVAKFLRNWQFLNIDMINKRTIDEVVVKREGVHTIKDLMVEPVTFRQGIMHLYKNRVANFGGTDEDFTP